jgi:hypothetical protein
MMNSPGEPLPERFPFGFPLLISPIIWMFPTYLDAPKVIALISTVLNTALLFWSWPWLSRSLSNWWGIAIAGLYAFSPLTIDFSRRIMAEPVFLTFSLISILLAEKFVRGSRNRWLIPCLSAALTLVVFTRTIGLTLVACVFFYFLFKVGTKVGKDILKIALLMGVLVGLVIALTPVRFLDLVPLWYLKHDKNARPLVSVISGEPAGVSTGEIDSDFETFSQIGVDQGQRLSSIRTLVISGFQHVFGENLRWTTIPFGLGVLRQIFDHSIGNASFVLQIFAYVISGTVVLGLSLFMFREQFSLFSFYPVIYFGALFFWNFNNPRLFYPIQPQIQIGWLVAIEMLILLISRVFRKFSIRSAYLGMVSLVTMMLAGSIFNSLQIEDSRVHAGDLRIRSEWLQAHTYASDIIMTEQPEVDYLYSGRKTVPYPNTLPTEKELEKYLIDERVDYILVAPKLGWFERYRPIYSDLTGEYLPAFERLRADQRIQLVYSLESDLIRVYRVQKETTRER